MSKYSLYDCKTIILHEVKHNLNYFCIHYSAVMKNVQKAAQFYYFCYDFAIFGHFIQNILSPIGRRTLTVHITQTKQSLFQVKHF